MRTVVIIILAVVWVSIVNQVTLYRPVNWWVAIPITLAGLSFLFVTRKKRKSLVGDEDQKLTGDENQDLTE